MNDADYICEQCGTAYPIRVMRVDCLLQHVTAELHEARRCGNLEAQYDLKAQLNELLEQRTKLTNPDR